MTTVDVAIVNWNTSGDAITSARAYSNSAGVDTNVMIFDNASEPEQRSILDEVGSTASVILSDENLGFGTAANRALEKGSAEFVLVSNADVLPDETAVAELVNTFKSIPKCGIVAPVMEDDVGYHDELPGPFTLLVRIPLGRFNRKPIRTPGPGETVTVGQPSGACFLTSRLVWEQLGGFDERFFVWYEDVDLAKRLHDSGRTSVIAGSARIRHVGGISFDRLSKKEQQSLRLASLELYLRIHYPRLRGFFRPLAILSRLLRVRRLSAGPFP